MSTDGQKRSCAVVLCLLMVSSDLVLLSTGGQQCAVVLLFFEMVNFEGLRVLCKDPLFGLLFVLF